MILHILSYEDFDIVRCLWLRDANLNLALTVGR